MHYKTTITTIVEMLQILNGKKIDLTHCFKSERHI